MNEREPPSEQPSDGSGLSRVFEQMLGTELGDYRIERIVGHGSMGVVFEAKHTTLERRVALKVLPPGLGSTERAIHRFLREAQAVAQLDHENIVPIYHVGEQNSVHYYAMQFLEGKPLDEYLHEHGSLRAKEAAQIVQTAARAIHFAHQRGIIHRDLKPANIIRTDQGKIVVTDFGLARPERGAALTDSGAMVGTPLYMSPEQVRARRDEVDRRTDVYSLGATLYELLAGLPPFTGASTQEILQAIIETEPRPLRAMDRSIPAELEVIALKALEKNPKRRYASALELAQDLERFLEGEPVLARRTGVVTRTLKRMRKHRTVSVLSGLVLLLLGASFGAAVVLKKSTDRRVLEQELSAAAADFEDKAYDSAMAGYHQVLEEEPENSAALLGYLRSLVEFGSLWEKRLDDVADAPPAQWQQQFGSPATLYENACPLADRLLKLAPEDPLAHLSRGKLQLRQILSEGSSFGPAEVQERFASVLVDLDQAESISGQAGSAHAWETLAEITRLRLALADEDTGTGAELNRGDRNQFLQQALNNITNAIKLREDEFNKSGGTDHRMKESLSGLHLLRASVYRELFRNSQVENAAGQAPGIGLYFDLWKREAKTAWDLWSDPRNQAAQLELSLARAMEPEPPPRASTDAEETDDSGSSGFGGLLGSLLSPREDERTEALAELIESGASGGASVLQGIQNYGTVIRDLERGTAGEETPTASEDRREVQENVEAALTLIASLSPGSRGEAAQFSKARDRLERAVDDDEDNSDLHYRLSSVCLELGDFSSAIEHSTLSVELAPTNPLYLEWHVSVHLGAVEQSRRNELSVERQEALLEEARDKARQLFELYPGVKKFEKLLEEVSKASNELQSTQRSSRS